MAHGNAKVDSSSSSKTAFADEVLKNKWINATLTVTTLVGAPLPLSLFSKSRQTIKKAIIDGTMAIGEARRYQWP